MNIIRKEDIIGIVDVDDNFVNILPQPPQQ